MEQPILVTQTSVFTIITLNRPDRRNALTIELMNELVDAVNRANADTSRRAIILHGAGEGFCAGLDLKEAQQSGSHEASARSVAGMLKAVHTSKLPTIAAVHGFAMAGGAGLMAACDLAVASADTKIGYPEVRRGLVPALVSTLLRHQIGERRLRELFLTAEPITADRALEFGLINRVVFGSAEAALNGAIELATFIAKGAPGALSATKQLLADLRPSSIDADLQKALSIHEHARTGDEATEGIAAFMEKRAPKWAP
ncbi:MAG: enoyl-CoA hydratase/isomerase family protein [Anaerolineae bacterium]|nr:enoyl-CoA hydratase/isomerase family protein [Phycisphaerae bacterium]